MRFRKPSPAMLVALLAVFIALGGTSYSAITLSKNSVTSKHIVNGQVKRRDVGKNAVTSRKVNDFSLLAKDFKLGQLPQGPKGDPGAVGERGPVGPPGPSEVRFTYHGSACMPPSFNDAPENACEIAGLGLSPVGAISYFVVYANTIVSNDSTETQTIECQLRASHYGSQTLDIARVVLAPGAAVTVSLTGVTAADQIDFDAFAYVICYPGSGAPIEAIGYEDTDIGAILVGNWRGGQPRPK